ncbi:DUF4158 domain-containing protein (plasmid) [Streptomyces sp. NBC_00841]|uniref:DUF4158 domain-containing protein n=1 Tax=unclassified Streptomyces TaxID=2593676 RepID=UPI002258CC54|nr:MULTISPECIES: DUF4158 domain-containing protein [unclassified Streptomyces]MCX4538860.1 DUF4158 domain-containing protein [Streptomyces sp. NBC_01669]WSA05347.1 DUF4158 domain-containing protein [Streptomyces sp. NBC_00841]
MRREWEPEDLIEVWTLLEEDQQRLRNKSGANRLGFALLLKFFEVEARFPEDEAEVPAAAVSYVAQQVKVPAEEWGAYDWSGRAIKRHRMEVRAAFGLRECTQEDQVHHSKPSASTTSPKPTTAPHEPANPTHRARRTALTSTNAPRAFWR